jgi:HflK protein
VHAPAAATGELVTEFLLQVLWQTWNIFKQASLFLLFGFLLAGVLAVLVPEKALARLFRTGKIRSVLWASAIGAPLPLCSCGVVPAALGLRRQGATPGATAAFLISTPETGLDSISISYALTDPIVTVFRPVTAVLTAICAGIGVNFFGARKQSDVDVHETQPEVEIPPDAHDHEHDHDHAAHDLESTTPGAERRNWRSIDTANRVYRYAFIQLLDDTSHWIVLGIVLSAIVAAAFPPTFFEQYLGSQLASMLVMMLLSIPIYVCASEATPVAAALVMKGLNPGAALVFLLVGPATNIGSIVMLMKFLGARIVAIYLASIVVFALLAGFALNWVYRAFEIDPQATFGAATAFVPEPVKVATALLLIVLLLASMRRTRLPAEWLWLRERLASLTGVRITWQRVVASTAAVTATLYLASGLFIVEPGEAGVRLRFGQIIAPTLDPGLHYRLPWPFESHRVVQTDRVQRIDYGFAAKSSQALNTARVRSDGFFAGGKLLPEAITTTGTWFQKDAAPDEPFLLTGDGNLINLRWAVQYRVKDPVAYAFNVAEPDAVVRAMTLAALRAIVARTGIDAIYTSNRSVTEEQVVHAVQGNLDRTRIGVDVLSFHLLYVHPPDEVHDAFRDVASAQEDKLRTINRANIFAVETVNQAKGEAAAMIEQSLAFEEQQILRAQGDAASFVLKLNAYRRAPELTQFRLQVETVETTLPGLQKFITPAAGDIKDFDMWLLQPAGANRSVK